MLFRLLHPQWGTVHKDSWGPQCWAEALKTPFAGWPQGSWAGWAIRGQQSSGQGWGLGCPSQAQTEAAILPWLKAPSVCKPRFCLITALTEPINGGQVALAT